MELLGYIFPFIILMTQIQPSRLLTQAEIDKIAYDLRVYAKVVENKQTFNDVTHTIRIILGNYELDPIPCCDWVLYFYSFHLLFPLDFPQTKEKILYDEKVTIKMIQGNLYSLQPMHGFGSIVQGYWRYITLTAKGSSVAVSDFMPNWYITQNPDIPGIWPAVVSDTMTLDFVLPFYNSRQWKRYPADRYDPVSPQVRAKRLTISDKRQIPPPKLVIPSPVRLIRAKLGAKNNLTIDATWRIRSGGPPMKGIARLLSEKILVRQTTVRRRRKVIILSKGNIGPQSEAYKITTDVNKEVVKITGKDNAGLFYGVQSVISLIDGHFGAAMSNVEINDYPRFPYRCFLLDVARNFRPVKDVKRVIEAMAMYKLNKLVLHLSDDEGWRINIRGLPELTEIGSRRCHDLNETECIISQLGSGPFEDTSGTGFYTDMQYKQILWFAKKHYVEVIPEIDAPGHGHAAIRSMEARFVRDGDSEYRLKDPQDRTPYLTSRNWFESAMNPCVDSTYNFIEHVLTHLQRLHNRIQPLRTFSVRGDGVPDGAWENSPQCHRLLRRLPRYNKAKGLEQYFAERMAGLTSRKRLQLLGSEDMFLKANDQPMNLLRINRNILVVARRNIWEQQQADLAYKFANKNYKVIMAQATHLYLDHPQEPNPSEPGIYWASRFTDTRKVFAFKPDDLYDNIDATLWGKPLTQSEVCGNRGLKCVKLLNSKAKNIIGMQAHLWTETVRTSERLDYMAFPRLLAFAERAWHKGKFEYNYLPVNQRMDLEIKDWEDFANTLGYKELWRLDQIDVQYRIPPPGASINNSYVTLNVEFPGLTPQYSLDSYDAPIKTWNNAFQPFLKGNGTVLLRTESAAGGRYSRTVYLH